MTATSQDGRHLREIVVVFSSPGDVASERDRLERVLHDVDAVFRAAGITVLSWQHKRNAYLGTGVDAQDTLNQQIPETYDLYVGILCQRLGTPTQRAISGTVEEFERALASGSHTFLYFCSALDARTDALSVKVRQWRDQFRGLYSSFQNGDDLAEQFKQHVLLWIVRNRLTPPVVTDGLATANLKPVWLPLLEREVTLRYGDRQVYCDRSVRWPRRVLCKLSALFDLRSLLSTVEAEALVATAYLLPLVVSDPEVDGHTVHAIGTQLDWGAEFCGCVELVLQASRPDFDANVYRESRAAVRSDVIGALLRLGIMLDLDQGALRHDGRPYPMETLSLDDWRARLTRRISVKSGMVRFELEAPSADWEAPLRTCTALALEAEWQRLRNTLTTAGFAMAIAPSETILSAHRQPAPPGLLDRLRREAERVTQTFPLPMHLGDARIASTDYLLPLPDTTVANDIWFTCGEGALHRLTVKVVGDADGVGLEILGDGPALVLEYSRLQQGRQYRWELARCGAGLGDDPVAAGEFRTLSDEPLALWRAAGALGESARRIIGTELGLRDETLKALWPRLENPSTTMEERLVVLRLLLDAARRAEQSAPWSTRVDAYRSAAHAVFEITTGKGLS